MKVLKRYIPILITALLLLSASCSNETKAPSETDSPSSDVTYNIRDRGPAGGFIFYDKGYYSDGWRYLEVAPKEIGPCMFGFYRKDGTTNAMVGTSDDIGKGKENTEKLFVAMKDAAYTTSKGSETTSEYAAKKCVDYTLNGYDDWFLPSRDELEMIRNNLYRERIYNQLTYWSSSEESINDAILLTHYFTEFGSGDRSFNQSYVLPVRSF